MNILIEIGQPAHVLKFSAAIKILEENKKSSLEFLMGALNGE